MLTKVHNENLINSYLGWKKNPEYLKLNVNAEELRQGTPCAARSLSCKTFAAHGPFQKRRITMSNHSSRTDQNINMFLQQ